MAVRRQDNEVVKGYGAAYERWGPHGATHSATPFWAASIVAMGLVALCFSGLLWKAAWQGPKAQDRSA